MRLGPFLVGVRASLGKHIDALDATNLFLLATMAAVTFYPLLFVGFTTNDDLMLAIESGQGNFWGSAHKFSAEQGRVGFLWAHPLFQVPYFFDNRIWYLATKYGSIFLSLAALYYAIFKIFRSSWIALASLVLFLAFVQNGWDHNALTSYPFVFNFLIALFLVSLGLFCDAIDRKSLALAGLSAGLYFLVLVNEFFVLFFPCYVAILASRGEPGGSFRERFASGWKYLLAIAVALVLYVAIYLTWRTLHPSSYTGNRPDGILDFLAAANVVATYGLSAFPVASLGFLFSPAEQLSYANSVGLEAILSDLSGASLIKACAAGLLFARLIHSANFDVPRARTLLVGAAFAFVAIFLPNVLVALTKKYQFWVASGSKSYLYTYHSFIAAVVFAALMLAYLKVKARRWNPKTTTVLASVGIMATICVSLAVDVRNQYIAFDQKLSHRKWQLMDYVIQSPAFADIPDGSTVVAPTLGAHQRGVAWAPNFYWTRYVKYKTGKNVRFVDDQCSGEAQCYSLVFRQQQHSDHQVAMLSKRSGSQPVNSEWTIYSMPNQRGVLLVGSFVPARKTPQIEIDGVPVANVTSDDSGVGLFSATLSYSAGAGLVQTAKVTGNVDLLPERSTISHYGAEPRLQNWSAELASGIDFRKKSSLASSIGASEFERQGYPELVVGVSGMSGYEPWGRWTDAAAGPVATFRFRQALPKRFALELIAGAFGPNIGGPIKIRVGNVEHTIVADNKKEPDTYRLIFETDGTSNALEIVPPKPTSPNEVDPNNRDTRKLGVSLFSIKIHDLSKQN